MRLKCIQRVYGHLVVRLDSPRSLLFRWKKTGSEEQGMGTGTSVQQYYLQIYPFACIVSAVFTEELRRPRELFVSVDFARGVDIVRGSDEEERPDLQGREFDFLFMAILRFPIRYAKSTLSRRMRKLRDIVEWRVNERLTSAAIGNLSARDSIAHCVCDNNYLLLGASENTKLSGISSLPIIKQPHSILIIR